MFGVTDFVKRVVGAQVLPFNLIDTSRRSVGPWDLYDATRKEDESPCSVFSMETRHSCSRFAQHALKKLKTIRHPNLLKFLDVAETDTCIYIVTERVMPLMEYLESSTSQETKVWGLFTCATGASFLLQAGNVHGHLTPDAVFVTQSGEWRLGGMEVISAQNDSASILSSQTDGSIVAQMYWPPEVQNEGWRVVTKYSPAAIDSWLFGCFMCFVFGGAVSNIESASAPKEMPAKMVPVFQRLLKQSPQERGSIADLLKIGTKPGSFFDTTLIRVSNFLETIAVKDNQEKTSFFGQLKNQVDQFPETYVQHKLLPALIHALEFGSAGPTILPLILQLGNKHLSEKEYQKNIVELIVRLFAQPDRAMRMALLENMSAFIEKLQQNIVTDQIFPQLSKGFADAAPILREATVKSVLQIISKLNERVINGDLLNYLSQMQNDQEPGIRTNTTICLGKISKHLNEATKKKVLIPAFTRALRDQFVPSRVSGLMAFSATADYYDATDIATKIIPCVSFLTIDPDRSVRQQTFKCIDSFLKRLETHSNNMRDPEPVPQQPNEGQNQSQPQAQSEGWAGWAVGTLAKKLVGSEDQQQIGTKNVVDTNSPPPIQSMPHVSAAPFTKTDIIKDDNDGWGPMDDSDLGLDLQVVSPPASSSGSGMKLSTSNSKSENPLLKEVKQMSFSQMSTSESFGSSSNSSQQENWGSNDFDDGFGRNESSGAGSKEERAAALAKKKEERRARIEALKQQRRANSNI